MTIEELAKLLIDELDRNSEGAYVGDDAHLTSVVLDGRFDMLAVAKAIAGKLQVTVSDSPT